MGISTNSKVAFVCANDESAWAKPYIDELNVPTKGSVGGFSSIDVPGAGWWDASDNDVSVPVRICEVLDNGRTIIMSSDFYGLINPARMDLPVSLQAVVYASESCQSEPQDPIYSVLAENVRSHNFSDTSEVNKPAWFDYDKMISEGYDLIEDAAWDEEAEENRFNPDPAISEYQDALVKGRDDAFTNLVARVKSLETLSTPFIEKPELATVMGFLKSINHEAAEEELGYDFSGCPQYPTWDYTNTKIIYDDYRIKLSGDLQKIIEDGKKIAAEAEAERQKYLAQFTPTKVGMSREEYASAYKASLEGAEDVTGILKVLETLGLPEQSGKKIKGYILERIESLTSPVGQKLIDATTGETLEALVRGIYNKGRWNNFKLEDEVDEEPAVEEEEDPEVLFQDSLANCEFDKIFSRADELKELILGSIDEIASNFTGENGFEATGEEPQWLLTALLKAGAEFGSGGGSDDDYEIADESTSEDNSPYRNEIASLLVRLEAKAKKLLLDKPRNNEAIEWVAKLRYVFTEVIGENGQSIANYLSLGGYGMCGFNEEQIAAGVPFEADQWSNDGDCFGFYHDYLDNAEPQCFKRYLPEGWVPTTWEIDVAGSDLTFEGKRVCITGKLGETREVWEAWVKDAGGTVAAGVSKTTDYLIAGSDAGSKLAKAEELGVTVLNEEQAKAILDCVCEEIQENWAALIIDKLTKDLPADTTDGYFKIDDSVEVHIEVGASVADIQTWLKERVGTESIIQQYTDPKEVEEMKIKWVAADKTNNVSVWYYDNECGSIANLIKVTLNTKEDVLAYCEDENSTWGGHLSVLKIVENEDGQTKVLVGQELTQAYGFDWGDNLSEIFNNDGQYQDLFELISDDTEDAEKEVEELIRKGLWPKQKN